MNVVCVLSVFIFSLSFLCFLFLNCVARKWWAFRAIKNIAKGRDPPMAIFINLHGLFRSMLWLSSCHSSMVSTLWSLNVIRCGLVSILQINFCTLYQVRQNLNMEPAKAPIIFSKIAQSIGSRFHYSLINLRFYSLVSNAPTVTSALLAWSPSLKSCLSNSHQLIVY